MWRDGGRSWSDAPISYGTSRILTTSSQKRQGRILPWSLQRESGPIDTLIMDFWPQELERIHFRCFNPPSLWWFVTTALGNLFRRGRGEPVVLERLASPLCSPFPSKNQLHYLAGILLTMKGPSTQHVPGDKRHDMGALSPFEQLDVDFLQLLMLTSQRNWPKEEADGEDPKPKVVPLSGGQASTHIVSFHLNDKGTFLWSREQPTSGGNKGRVGRMASRLSSPPSLNPEVPQNWTLLSFSLCAPSSSPVEISSLQLEAKNTFLLYPQGCKEIS